MPRTDRISYVGNCWLWDKVNNVGYPNNAEHRKAYERAVGPIPEGHHLHHRCGRKACVNPEHLEPVTRNQNMSIKFAETYGQMGKDNLRKARYFHDQMTEKMRAGLA